MSPITERLEQARVLSYQQPARSRELAVSAAADALAAADHVAYGRARWLVALADVRIGAAADAAAALTEARRIFVATGHEHDLRLCDEVRAIALRRAGDLAGCRSLIDEIDRRHPLPSDDFDTFLALNSRALTFKGLGQTDRALSNFYAAAESADRLGWVGPRVVATANLGGFHLDLYNLDEALALSRRAQQGALAAEMAPIIGTTTANLIVVHWGLGQRREARRLADFLIGNEHRLMPGALHSLASLIALGFLAGGDLRPAQHWLDEAQTPPVSTAHGADLTAWVQARVHLESGDAGAAVQSVDAALAGDDLRRVAPSPAPFDRLELLRTAADACERHGDIGRAMALLRRTQQVHEDLLGRSARARLRALQAESDRLQARQDHELGERRELELATERRRAMVLDEALRAQTQANARLTSQLREQAARDPDTGLANRRHLQDLSTLLLASARRRGQPLAVALIDIGGTATGPAGATPPDPGHATAFAQRLCREVRASDAVCRWDDGAFVLLMPDTDGDRAARALNRLRACLGRPEAPPPGDDPVDAAAGGFRAAVATLDDGDFDLEPLVRRAGDRLREPLGSPGAA